MKKIVVIIFSLFLFQNVYALDLISADDLKCTLTNEYKEYMKLSEKEKSKTIEPIKCKELINSAKLSGINLSAIDQSKVNASYFNLKDENYLPAVKDQGESGLCWSFTTMSAIESNLLLNNNGSANLSEKHLGYSLIKNLGNNQSNPYYYPKYNYMNGGNYIKSYVYLSKLRGPVLESNVPYWDTSYTESRITSEVNSLTLNQINNPKAKYYVDEETLLLSESKCTSSMINEIKKLIVSNGIVGAMMYGGTEYDPMSNYFSPLGAYYYTGAEDATHAMSIIGWDDNYAKENFIAGKRPQNDGAWIIMQSYDLLFGTNNPLGKGYHYISYEDPNICKQVMSVSNITENNYDNTYYYDIWGFGGGVFEENNIIFREKYHKTNNANEILSAINAFFLSKGDKVEVYYSGIDDYTSAIKIAEGTSNATGYTTLNTNTNIQLLDDFYIFYKYASQYSKIPVMDYNDTNTASENYTNLIPSGAVTYKLDGNSSWVENKIENTNIKAVPLFTLLTKNINYNFDIANISSSTGNNLKISDNGYYSIKINNLSNVSINNIITTIYDSSNNDVTSKFSVEKNANESTIKIIKTNNSQVGDYRVVLSYESVTKETNFSILPETNIKITAMNITSNVNEITVNGTANLSVQITPTNATNKKISWTSSNTSIATVDENGIVRGISPGTVTITASTTDGTNIKKSLSIKIISINNDGPSNSSEQQSQSTSSEQSEIQQVETGIKDTYVILILIILASIIPIYIINKKTTFKRV